MKTPKGQKTEAKIMPSAFSLRLLLPFPVTTAASFPPQHATLIVVMRTVLIADSDPFQRQLIDMLLAVDNHRVIGFETGRAVLEYLQAHVPDLVILDYSLPDINGADLCAKMKKVKRLAHVPVILVTAAHKLDLVRGIAGAVRANLVLAKPLGDKHLREQVLELLQRSGKPLTHEPLPPEPTVTSSEIRIDPVLEQALANLRQEWNLGSSGGDVKKHSVDKPSLNTITPVPIDRDDGPPYTLELPSAPLQPSSHQPDVSETPPPLFKETLQSQESSHEGQRDTFQQDANAALESLLGQDDHKKGKDTDSGVFEVFDVDNEVRRGDQGISEQELLDSLQTPLEPNAPVKSPLFGEPTLNPPPYAPDVPTTGNTEGTSLEPEPYTLGGAALPSSPALAASFDATVSDIETELENYRTQVKQLAAENERLRATLLELESGSALVTSKSYLDMVEELEMLRRLTEIQVKQMDSLQRQNLKLLEDAQQAQERRRGLFGFLKNP